MKILKNIEDDLKNDTASDWSSNESGMEEWQEAVAKRTVKVIPSPYGDIIIFKE